MKSRAEVEPLFLPPKIMPKLTVYVVYNKKKDLYYGSKTWSLVSLKDAKIFSKRNTASACCNRVQNCVVVPCTLRVLLDALVEEE